MTAPRLAAVVALLAAFACGPSSPAPLSQADRDAVRQAGQELKRAVLEGDWEAVASHYAEDAFLDPPDSPPLTGRSAIRDHYAGSMGGVSELEVDPMTVDGEGNLAYVRGSWSLTARAPGAAADSTVSGGGGYVVVRRRQPDGRWLITEHIVHRRPPGLPTAPTGGG